MKNEVKVIQAFTQNYLPHPQPSVAPWSLPCDSVHPGLTTRAKKPKSDAAKHAVECFEIALLLEFWSWLGATIGRQDVPGAQVHSCHQLLLSAPATAYHAVWSSDRRIRFRRRWPWLSVFIPRYECLFPRSDDDTLQHGQQQHHSTNLIIQYSYPLRRR